MHISLKEIYQTVVESSFCKASICRSEDVPFTAIVWLSSVLLLLAHLPSFIQYGALLFATSTDFLNQDHCSV